MLVWRAVERMGINTHPIGTLKGRLPRVLLLEKAHTEDFEYNKWNNGVMVKSSCAAGMNFRWWWDVNAA